MKHLVIISIIIFSLFSSPGCSFGEMKFEDAITPLEISENDIQDLNEIQDWIEENKEIFIETAFSQENTYSSLPHMRDFQSYSLPFTTIEKYIIKKTNPVPQAILRHTPNQKENFIISNIESRPHDAMTTYIVFQKTFEEKILTHKISNEILPENYNYTFHFKLDDEWHYTVTTQ